MKSQSDRGMSANFTLTKKEKARSKAQAVQERLMNLIQPRPSTIPKFPDPVPLSADMMELFPNEELPSLPQSETLLSPDPSNEELPNPPQSGTILNHSHGLRTSLGLQNCRKLHYRV